MATLHCHCQVWVLEKQDDDYEGSGPDTGDYKDTPILNKFKQILEDEWGDVTPDATMTLSWTEFKKKAEESYVVVATGEPTPHGSIILEAGVVPMGAGGDDYSGVPGCPQCGRPPRFG